LLTSFRKHGRVSTSISHPPYIYIFRYSKNFVTCNLSFFFIKFGKNSIKSAHRGALRLKILVLELVTHHDIFADFFLTQMQIFLLSDDSGVNKECKTRVQIVKLYI
jgi:hypothetical protein